MIIAGIGCRRLCPASDIVAAIRDAATAAHCIVGAIAAPEFKRHEPGLQAAATLLDLPLHFIDDAALHQVQPACVTHSRLAEAVTGHASIAEAAALAATSMGNLILPRISHGQATCALAASRGRSTTEDTESTEDVLRGAAGLISSAKQQQAACGARFSVSSVIRFVREDGSSP